MWRHELEVLSWARNSLTAAREIVGNDAYTLYVLEPAGYMYQGVECDGAKVVAATHRGQIREVTVLSELSATVK